MNQKAPQLSLFQRLCRWSIHESIWTGDPDQLRRAKLSLIIPISLVGFGAPFALLFEFILRNRAGAIGVVITCFFAILAPLVLRWTRSVWFAGNYSVFVVFCLLIVNGYICGGIGSAPLTWEFALPVAAIFLAGKRSGIFWAIACAAVFVGFYVMHRMGLESEHGLPKEGLIFFYTAASVALVFVITSFAYFYEVIKDEALQETKRTQGMLFNSAKMTALGEVAGGVSHEINNPLTVVRLQLDMIANDLKHATDERERSLLARIQKISAMAGRISVIVKGLLDFSLHLDADNLDTVPVRRVVESTLQLCQERIRAGGIDLRVVESGMPLQIVCRPMHLSQVLMNLLNNSYDAVQGQSEKWIQLDAKDTGRWVEISVTDSGSGVPAEQQDKIFQPFFTTKEVGKGTGLGLSVAKGLIESQNGAIYLDLTSARTRFVVRLPKQSG